ncbi:MAG TPA: hypothetical protein DCZ13_11090 [Porticoccaceae bacterium]|nr:hypothetical protein [Porticoccaceae bacterium]
MGKTDGYALIDGRIDVVALSFADRMPARKLGPITLAEIPACSQYNVIQVDITTVTNIHPVIFIRLGRSALDGYR